MFLRLLILISFILLSAAAMGHAAPLAAPVRAEIEALLSSLEKSGCRFNRNGSWYLASEAKKHLLTKVAYLEDRSAVRDTEEFIDLAASASSISGRAYLVQCGDNPPVASRQWLREELARIRSSVDTQVFSPQ